jgi:cyclophilin family peptidyl-prolyl cis-trans isomerase
MKKILMMIGVAAITLTLSACGTQNNSDNLNGTDVSPEATNNVSVESPVVPIVSEIKTTQSENTSTITTTTTTTNSKEDLTRVVSGQKDLLKDYTKAIIKTSEGDIIIKFYPEAPITVNNFMNLAQKGFYDGTKFHRIMEAFMIQGGDPLTKNTDASVYGTGGPGYAFKNEDSGHKLVAGNIAMANAGMNTNGSQFFIVTATSTPFLDGGYTNFGEVLSGMSVVRKIEASKVTQSPSGEMSVPVDYVTVKSVQIIK